jgi:hypothetical protein
MLHAKLIVNTLVPLPVWLNKVFAMQRPDRTVLPRLTFVPKKLIVTLLIVTRGGPLDRIFDLLTTLTHNS